MDYYSEDCELGLACHGCSTQLKALPYYWRCGMCQMRPYEICDFCYQNLLPDQHIVEHVWIKINPSKSMILTSKSYLELIYHAIVLMYDSIYYFRF